MGEVKSRGQMAHISVEDLSFSYHLFNLSPYNSHLCSLNRPLLAIRVLIYPCFIVVPEL